MPANPRPAPSSDEIAARAHELWQIAGSRAGGPEEFRAAAEGELRKHGETTRRAANDPVSQAPERPSRR